MIIPFSLDPKAIRDTLLDYFDNSNRDDWHDYLQPLIDNDRHFLISTSLFRAVSSGHVRLASDNIQDAPSIDPKYFSKKQDLISIVRSISRCLKIVESPYFAPYAQYTTVSVPGCTLCTDRPMSECFTYLTCVSQAVTSTSYHPCGTARMGNSSNVMAVVDERLRVYNVTNLRVVDASIMPTVPNANINAATFMIGEKGSHLILQDQGLAF